MIIALFIFTTIAVFGAGWKLSECCSLAVLGMEPNDETVIWTWVWTIIAIVAVIVMLFVLIVLPELLVRLDQA